MNINVTQIKAHIFTLTDPELKELIGDLPRSSRFLGPFQAAANGAYDGDEHVTLRDTHLELNARKGAPIGRAARRPKEEGTATKRNTASSRSSTSATLSCSVCKKPFKSPKRLASHVAAKHPTASVESTPA